MVAAVAGGASLGVFGAGDAAAGLVVAVVGVAGVLDQSDDLQPAKAASIAIRPARCRRGLVIGRCPQYAAEEGAES